MLLKTIAFLHHFYNFLVLYHNIQNNMVVCAGNIHVVSVTVGASGPAAKVHGALEEELAVGGREEMGAEDHK